MDAYPRFYIGIRLLILEVNRLVLVPDNGKVDWFLGEFGSRFINYLFILWFSRLEVVRLARPSPLQPLLQWVKVVSQWVAAQVHLAHNQGQNHDQDKPV